MRLAGEAGSWPAVQALATGGPDLVRTLCGCWGLFASVRRCQRRSCGAREVRQTLGPGMYCAFDVSGGLFELVFLAEKIQHFSATEGS